MLFLFMLHVVYRINQSEKQSENDELQSEKQSEKQSENEVWKKGLSAA